MILIQIRYAVVICRHHGQAKPVLPEFLKWASARFDTVLYIPGNHEYYSVSSTMKEVHENLLKICGTFSNVRMMTRDTGPFIVRPGVRIVGCTLWTSIPDWVSLGSMVTDYRLIRRGRDDDGKLQPVTVPDLMKEHHSDNVYVFCQMDEARRKNERLVVLTHHAPVFKSTSKILDPNQGGPSRLGWLASYAFCNNLEYYTKTYECPFNSTVSLWCFGHTHTSSEQLIHGTRIVSNQRGYPHEPSKYPNGVPNAFMPFRVVFV